MPFAFSQLQPLDTGRITHVDVPLGEYVSNAFDQGVSDSMFTSIMRIRELDLEQTGRVLTPEEANATYGLKGILEFDKPTYESEARVLRERKDAELRRNFYLASGNPDGLFSFRGAMGLGAGMLGNVLNPLDLAANFIPVVGSEAQALRAAKLGRGAFRQALERGLFAAESLGRLPAPRLTTALVNAGVGNIVAEIPHIVSAIESKENYTPLDSVIGVATGTALGASLHIGLHQAAKIFNKLMVETKTEMLKKAINDFVTGKDIDVTTYVEIDENMIAERVKFNEQAAQQDANARVDVEKIKARLREKYGEYPVKAAFKFSNGEIRTAPAHYLIDIAGLDPDSFNAYQEGFVTNRDRFITREEAEALTGIKREGGVISEDLPSPVLPAPEQEMMRTLIAAGAAPEDAAKEIMRIKAELEDRRLFARKDIQEKLELEKARRVKAIVTRERNKYDERGRFKQELAAEVNRQIQEGRTMTDEQAKKWGFRQPEREKATATIEDEIKSIAEELNTEEASKTIDETVKKEHAAIDQAVDCLLKNPSVSA